jgi:hypothetical protein
VIDSALLAAAAKGFSSTLGKLAAEHAIRAAINSPERVERLRSDITPHLEATYNKCITIKTLLNPYTPADFLSIYATQRFSRGNIILDHYDFVELIKKKEKNTIITGTGGSGKSMFMRYLWLSIFVDGDGKIPIFAELRNINSVNVPDLVSYLYHTLSQGASSITLKKFNAMLESGDFVIILDGFDEVNLDKRQVVQSAIIELSEIYPALKLIVSSRPDDRFVSWPSFHVSSVAPMQKKDVLELVQKAEFDPVHKEKFYKKVKSGDLYPRHESFLANPLLASMMLLTFSYNFDIPDRMHLFYGQAFDALYKRHDSHKPGGYKREFKTKLSEDAFKRLLSYFCLITYYDQTFEFTNDQLSSYVSKAVRLSGYEVEVDDFIRDIKECVCLIVPEGIKFVFSHRSFQEYFSAYCMAFVTQKNFNAILKRFAGRYNDQTAVLLSDMAPELFREEYVIPEAKNYEDVIEAGPRSLAAEKFLQRWGTFVAKIEDEKRLGFIDVTVKNLNREFDEYSNLIQRIFDLESKSARRRGISDDLGFLNSVRDLFGAGELNISSVDTGFVFEVSSEEKIFAVSGSELETVKSLFKQTGMHEFIFNRQKALRSYILKARAESSSSENAMRDVFDLK